MPVTLFLGFSWSFVWLFTFWGGFLIFVFVFYFSLLDTKVINTHKRLFFPQLKWNLFYIVQTEMTMR